MTSWSRIEWSMEAQEAVQNPYAGVRVRIEAEGPSAQMRRFDAFWDGGRVWCARLLANEPGSWRWTATSEPSIAGLHKISGTVEAQDISDGSPWLEHGPLELAPDRRSLRHADGTPLYWLADTAWNLARRLTPEDVSRYAARRAAQGFNAVQWVASFAREGEGSPKETRCGWSYPNREGARPFGDPVDFRAADPTYFQMIDRQMNELESAGLLSVFLPMWGFMSDPYPHGEPPYPGHTLEAGQPLMSEDEAVLYGRYLAARYGAHFIVWMLGGDVVVHNDRAMSFWRALAHSIREAGGDVHPMTYHPMGGRSSSQWLHAEPWLDFNTCQSGHSIDNQKAIALLQSDWRLLPVKPTLNSEPAYEGLPHGIRPKDDQPARVMGADQVRRAFFWSLLSGGVGGHTYGANNGFQMDRAGTYYTLESGSWEDNLEFPGAQQIGAWAQRLRKLPVQRLVPRFDAASTEDPDALPVVMASTDVGDFAVVYFPTPAPAMLRLSKIPSLDGCDARWVSADGNREESADSPVAEDSVWTPPFADDTILLLARG